MSNTNLDSLWTEWINLHAELSVTKPQSTPVSLSAPFFSAPPKDDQAGHKLLFVGKATNSWYKDVFADLILKQDSTASIIQEVQNWNSNGIEQDSFKGNFWHTFRAVSKKLGGHQSYQNASWSNVMKIGLEIGNPDSWLMDKQAALAAETLKAEIKQYQPSLVMFVTHSFADEVILQATSTQRNDWRWSERKPALEAIDKEAWWIPRSADGGPAFLWTEHPQGKTAEKRQFWAQWARELSDGNKELSAKINN